MYCTSITEVSCGRSQGPSGTAYMLPNIWVKHTGLGPHVKHGLKYRHVLVESLL